ncbi:APC family permease [Streptomyces sp. NPDC057474]|uniref:APC family permease n=1 Tax=Streptomyces sp. NPDC057474 TaxID=3346144 RepID=UPI0036CBD78E
MSRKAMYPPSGQPAPSLAISPAPHEPSDRLHGNMGVFQLIFTVLAFNAPLGIIAGVVPLSIGFGVGIGTPLLLIMVCALMAVYAVGYTVMSRRIPGAGAFYTFVTAGLGRPAGLSASFIAVVGYTLGMTGILPFVGLAMESLITTFHGPDTPWWVWSLVVACGAAVLGVLRVDFSARVLGILLVLEVFAVLVFDAAVVVSGGDTGHLSAPSFNPQHLFAGGLAAGLAYAFIAFSGFESTAIFRDEVRDPERTVPRATYLSVALLGILYSVGSWLLVQAYGEDNAAPAIAAGPASAFLGSMREYVGLVAFDITTVLVVTSSFASVTAIHNVIARYLFNLGLDGILPRSLGTPHPRFGSPHRASIVLSVVTVGFVLLAAASSRSATKIYATLTGTAGYFLLLLMCLSAVGIVAYLVRQWPTEVTVWHRIIAPVTAAAVMIAVAITMTSNIDLLTGSSSASAVAIAVLIGCMVTGSSVAVLLRSRRPDIYRRIGTRE